MKIRTQFTLFANSLLLLTTGVLILGMYSIYRNILRERIQFARETQMLDWTTVCRETLEAGNTKFMAQYAQMQGAKRDVDYAYFSDETGKILAHTYPRFIGKPESDWIGQVNLGSEVMAAPVRTKAGKAGKAVIGFSGRWSKNLFRELAMLTVLQVLILAGLLVVMSMVVVGLFFDRVTSRFQTLQKASLEIEAGNFNVRVPPDSAAELTALGTAFNHMAQKLSSLDKMKDEFIYTVSHELKAPLAAIIMYADHLINDERESADLHPRHKEILRTIVDNGRRMSMYIMNILDVAKIKAGRMVYAKKPVALIEPVAGAVALYAILAKKQAVELHVRVPGDLPQITADPDQLQQAIGNLLSNALKFTPRGGRISLEGRTEDSHVELAVRDTGSGMSPDKLAKLFQPFVHSTEGETHRRMIRGTGLGLYIVKQAVTAMGGTTTVESKVNEGTSFILRFPRAATAQ